jgi:outer membrane protein
MRFSFRALVAPTLLAFSSCVAYAQQQGRIVYVNPQALFAAAPGRAEAQAVYEKETAAYRAELSKMSDALTATMSDYQKNESKLSDSMKVKRQRQIQAKEDSLRARQTELEQQASERQSQLMAPIMETVRKVLEDIRAEDGYALILSSEPGASPILAADKNLDITERVIARLKTVAAASAKPTTPPQKPVGAPAATPSGVTRPKPPGA